MDLLSFLILSVCMITVAANLQKIVEEPQSNRSVTFKLVLISSSLLNCPYIAAASVDQLVYSLSAENIKIWWIVFI